MFYDNHENIRRYILHVANQLKLATKFIFEISEFVAVKNNFAFKMKRGWIIMSEH